MRRIITLSGAYAGVLALIILISYCFSESISVAVGIAPPNRKTCFIIDAGHGGEDGGAVSCSGTKESEFNLNIALRLNDLLHLLGYKTIMIRTTDISVYTEGVTLAAKKFSDLKERLRVVNSTENAVLISIHQNYFHDSQYSGAQVFYGKAPESQILAKNLQRSLIFTLGQQSNRGIKAADSIYLMNKAQCTAVLVECGFLSNQHEEYLLKQAYYQKRIVSAIATELAKYANT